MASNTTIETVTSPDGTPIAVHRTGGGPPLVLVHGGAASTHLDWEPVAAALAERFTVYAMDRRGRGGSGDAGTYEVEREFEDVAAVVEAVPARANLLGHSFGALCALEAARLTDDVAKLVLYEPVLPEEGDDIFPDGLLREIDELIDHDELEAALVTVVRSVGYTDDEIESLKAENLWRVGVEATPTVTRELRALDDYRFDPGRFAGLDVPIGLLSGSESPPLFRTSTAVLDEGLPNSRVITLHGQAHEAKDTDPRQFVDAVVSFLLE